MSLDKHILHQCFNVSGIKLISRQFALLATFTCRIYIYLIEQYAKAHLHQPLLHLLQCISTVDTDLASIEVYQDG